MRDSRAALSYRLGESSWDHREIEALKRVIDSGFYSMGSEVKAFEEAFADYVGSRYCVMVNSGSSANLLMVAALRYRKGGLSIRTGDEVIVPPVSWSTSYYPFSQYGIKLRFVDIDRETLNYDLAALSSAVDENVSAILAVNLLGNPNDFDEIQSLISGRDILLIEDNCESMGACYNDRQCGTFGVMGSYSCFFSHHISTMEGGLIVTDDEELFHILLCLRAHGWTRNLPDTNSVAQKSQNKIEEDFHFVLPGYNLRPLEMAGAIGQAQMEKLPSLITFRRKNAMLFLEIMAEFPQISVQKEIGKSSWFGFSLIVHEEGKNSRADVVSELERYNIDYRPIVTGNFAKNSKVMRWLPHTIFGDLKNADWLDRNGLFVGNHGRDLSRELELLQKALTRALA